MRKSYFRYISLLLLVAMLPGVLVPEALAATPNSLVSPGSVWNTFIAPTGTSDWTLVKESVNTPAASFSPAVHDVMLMGNTPIPISVSGLHTFSGRIICNRAPSRVTLNSQVCNIKYVSGYCYFWYNGALPTLPSTVITISGVGGYTKLDYLESLTASSIPLTLKSGSMSVDQSFVTDYVNNVYVQPTNVSDFMGRKWTDQVSFPDNCPPSGTVELDYIVRKANVVAVTAIAGNIPLDITWSASFDFTFEDQFYRAGYYNQEQYYYVPTSVSSSGVIVSERHLNYLHSACAGVNFTQSSLDMPQTLHISIPYTGYDGPIDIYFEVVTGTTSGVSVTKSTPQLVIDELSSDLGEYSGLTGFLSRFFDSWFTTLSSILGSFQLSVANGFQQLQVYLTGKFDDLTTFFTSKFSDLTTFLGSKFDSFYRMVDEGFLNVLKALNPPADTSAGDTLDNQMAAIDNVEAGHQQVMDSAVPQLTKSADISQFAVTLAFVGGYATRAFNGLGSYQVVITLPLVIGLICYLCSRVPGITHASRASKSRNKEG